MKPRFIIFSLLTIVAILFANPSSGNVKPVAARSQQLGQGPILCITSAPTTTAFPNMALNFRMVDANLSPIIPTEADLRFSENDQTPVTLAGGIQRDPNGVGINYYIVVDKGNRTVQTSVRSVLQILTNYVNEPVDTVKIYTNENNNTEIYYPGSIANSFSEAVAKFPVTRIDSYPRQVTRSLDKVLNEVQANSDPCKNMSVIILIAGDEAIYQTDILMYAQRIKTSIAKLALFHLSGLDGSFDSRDIYKTLADNGGGIYQPVQNLENDIKPVLDNLSLYKHVLTATYRTNYGASGTHTIGATYQNANIQVKGLSSYQVDVRPPVVTLEGEAVISRMAQKVTESGDYIYNIDSLPYVMRINWGDSNPRNIKSVALVVKEGNAENEIASSLQSKGDNAYEIIWNFSQIKPSGGHTLYLSVKLTDEFDNQVMSSPLEISLTNNIEALPAASAPRELMWGLYVLVAIVILLCVLMIFMWRRMLTFAKQGGAAIGKIAGEIRRTIVGGAKRGKPLATFKVLEGPPTMIGQELKVYTEGVKLGRNPQLADMTFYGPDVITSVSGLHARVEKISGSWRIVALSQSGSETFIDDQPIPFNEPANLRSGQKIRMGYYAQQPVVLEFQTKQAETARITSIEHTDDIRRKTEVKMDPEETLIEAPGFFSRPNKKVQTTKKQGTENNDSVFDEFR